MERYIKRSIFRMIKYTGFVILYPLVIFLLLAGVMAVFYYFGFLNAVILIIILSTTIWICETVYNKSTEILREEKYKEWEEELAKQNLAIKVRQDAEAAKNNLNKLLKKK